ncbi:MAG TPA: hypothetical protein VGG39_23445 [Polyangiaceae bacterium]|jgi:hypothetical protein
MANKQTSKNSDASYKGRTMKAQGPDKSSGVGKGGRSSPALSSDIQAMKSKTEKLPAGAQALSSGEEKVPAVDAPLIKSSEPWDLKRDRALEKGSSK